MTVKRKKKSSLAGGRTVTVAFSLCLLAVVTMIGMYTVGRTDEQQKKLEQQVAEAEEQARAREEAEQAKAEEEARALEEQRQEAASAAAARDREGEETPVADGAELESEFAQSEDTSLAENLVIDELQEAGASDAVSGEPALSFSAAEDRLLWPVAGNVLMDYSMDKSVYFATLEQYKYNPAVIIEGSLDENVLSAAQGKITKVETLEETGTTVTMDIGDGYEVIYGQLKELAVKEGDFVKAGETLGYVSEPTRYYTKEGCNVYFEVRHDGESVDPMSLLS